MKRLALTAVLVVSSVALAGPTVTFNFDSLHWLSGPDAIESYMESVYGSNIEVNGGIAANGILSGPLHDYRGDKYIQAGPLTGSDLGFAFTDRPITSVQFAWSTKLDTLTVDADGQQIFYTGNSSTFPLVKKGQTSLITFDSPVHSLQFRDSCCLGAIAIDDLKVTKASPTGATIIPSPTALALSALGVLLVGHLRRRNTR